MIHRKIDPARVLADLEPEQLGALAGAAYARRRERDLARALSSPLQPRAADLATAPGRARRRTGLVAATATAGLALAAVVALVAAPLSSSSPPAGGEKAALPTWQRDTRAVLLLSAKRVALVPDTGGRYWYTRQRRAEPDLVVEAGPSGATHHAPPQRTPATSSPSSTCEDVPAGVEHAAVLLHVHTVETWSAAHAGDRSRVVSNQDPKVMFPTPADEEQWRRIGAELPWPARPQVEDLHESGVRIDGDGRQPLVLGMNEVRALPTTAPRLERVLRRLFQERQQQLAAEAAEHGRAPRSVGFPGFPSFVWAAAGALLPAPTTPGTRAAIYELLAGQHEGIRMVGRVTDPLGRDGVGLAWPYHDPATGLASESRLIIEPDSGRLLAHDAVWKAGQKVAEGCDTASGRGVARGWTAYEAAGWTDRIGVRP